MAPKTKKVAAAAKSSNASQSPAPKKQPERRSARNLNPSGSKPAPSKKKAPPKSAKYAEKSSATQDDSESEKDDESEQDKSEEEEVLRSSKTSAPRTKTKRTSQEAKIAQSARGERKKSTQESVSKRRKIQGETSLEDSVMFDAGPEEDEDLSPAFKKRKTPVKKRGAVRVSKATGKQDVPGDPQRPSSFIKIENNEQKLGSYVGYDNVSSLRKLVISWPVLKAYVAFSPISANMPKNKVFLLIREGENQFLNVDPASAWPLDNPKEEEEVILSKRRRHVATILLTLERDIETMHGNHPLVNRKQQLSFVDLFSKLMSEEHEETVTVPFVAFGDKSEPKVLFPKMSGYPGESRMEAVNRCWNLLKYLSFCLNTAGTWVKRFTDAAIKQKVTIDESHVPSWMLPPKVEQKGPFKIAKTANVIEADALTPLEIRVIWNIDEDFDEKEELDAALASAKKKNIPLPTTMQVLHQDPRLLRSIEAFRDSLRRQFDCQKLGINLRTLELSYLCPKVSANILRKDILRDSWESTRSTFADAENTTFVINMTLEALEDPENENIYETFAAPPAIEEFFNIVDDDVEMNHQAIDAIAAAAFDHAENVVDDGEAKGLLSDEAAQTFLDLAFGHGRSADDIGSPPNPRKKFPRPQDFESMLAYYDGYDVTTEEGKRDWQKSVLAELTKNGSVAKVTIDKIPKDFAKTLSKEEAESIKAAQAYGEIIAMGQDEQDLDTSTEAGAQRYHTLQTALSGLNSRTGPFVDVAMKLLDCVPDPDPKAGGERFIPRLLKSYTKRSFYAYQISGAIGVVMKLYGKIDAEKLLRGTGNLKSYCAANVRNAAAALSGLLIHGAILADEVGLGKTMQGLLVACLHGLLYDATDEKNRIAYRPMLLVLPPALVSQWTKEILSYWPGLVPIMSYSEHEFKTEMELQTLSYTFMSEYPSKEALPSNLKWVFDTKNPKAASAIIITSYETNMARAGEKKTKKIPGVPYKPPRFDANGTQMWKTRPRTKNFWVSNQKNMYSLLIADEAQKIKNLSTGVWSVIWLQSFRKTLLLTATPVYNSMRDILALLYLFWAMAEVELKAHCVLRPEASDWLMNVNDNNLDIMEEVGKLEETNPLRLAALRPELLRRTINTKTDLHLKVSNVFKVVLDLTMIQRSLSSTLPVKKGQPIELKSLFKKVNRKTATISRSPEEELEYQFWHRKGAKQYINEMTKDGGEKSGAPTKPRAITEQAGFICAVKALRTLAIANFSTKLARLNSIMERANSNTHVERLAEWRAREFDGQLLHDLTRGAGEPECKTARELLVYLCDGSPVVRLAFQEILTANVLEKLDKGRYKHQKLLCAENLPVNAFYLQIVMRCALIDARVMTSALSNKGKSDMVTEFNNPKSTFKVLIMMYDVGAAGLNLHKACNRALILSIARALALEKQVGGRILRVTSEFDVTITIRYTANSHDAFCAARQTDKATVTLAANAQDPELRKLMVQLLNELQPQVDACHLSVEGQKILAKMEEDKKIQEIALDARKTSAKRRDRREKLDTETAKEASKLDEGLAFASRSNKRVRKEVERYDDQEFDDQGMLLSMKERKKLRVHAQHTQTCELCLKKLLPPDGDVCEACYYLAHYTCHKVTQPPEGEGLYCLRCINAGAVPPPKKVSKSTSRKGKEIATEEDDPDFEQSEVESEEGGNEARNSGKSEWNDDEEGSDDESEDDFGDDGVNLRKQKLRDDLIEAREEAIFLRSISLDEFLNEDQPDDRERHQMALTSIPPQKIWHDGDLNTEAYLRLGLQLLYNKIQGKKELHVSKSIHIRYSAFPKDICERMTKDRKIDASQIRRAKVKAA